MRRVILALALALGLALAVVGPAAAGKINLYTGCAFSSPSLRTSGGSNTNQTVANPVRLGFGWAAQKQQQVQQFLNAQYANTVSITDAAGTEFYPYEHSWLRGLGSFWGPIVPTMLTSKNGAQFSGYASTYRTPDFTLPDGQYYLHLDLDLATGVNDGQNAAGPGSWLTITNCPFTVTG